MRLMKRNTVTFRYYPYIGEHEVLDGERHTGIMRPKYGVPFEYHGNLSAPSNMAQANLFGLNTPYTHVLLTEAGAEIAENGTVECGGRWYDVTAVRPTMNTVSIALKQRTNAPEVS